MPISGRLMEIICVLFVGYVMVVFIVFGIVAGFRLNGRQ